MRIACIGRGATHPRVTYDLDLHKSMDRRVLYAQRIEDMERLRGIDPKQCYWVDMGASPEQKAFLAARDVREMSIIEARDALRNDRTQ
jgi:hypothetical protein